MAKRCPRGFICSDTTTVWLFVVGIALIIGGVWYIRPLMSIPKAPLADSKIYIVSQPPIAPVAALPPRSLQSVRPDLYPEPVQRMGAVVPALASRGGGGPIQQVGILTGEGGSSSAAAPDRTILPLYGRELDPRRGKWTYYTRTDGTNPVQVPVRVRNRLCDDDTNGCDEVYNDDAVHVPSLGRSFTATIYRKSLFA